MNDHIIPLPPAAPGAESPFDSIRQIRNDGSEFWSARDLMPLLGYERWENFEASIARAKAAAMAQGNNPSDHFRDAGKVIEGGRWGSQTVADCEMTRFGSYLVAMNGDPRKPEVAAAQAYFAIRTREAEVREAKELSGPELMAKAILEAQATLAAKDEQIKQLVPKAIAWERFCSSTGDMSASEAAKTLARGGYDVGGLHKLYALCDKKRSDGGLGWFFRNGHEQREPYQSVIDRGLIRVKTSSIENSRTGEMFVSLTPRFTAKALDAIAKHVIATQEKTA